MAVLLPASQCPPAWAGWSCVAIEAQSSAQMGNTISTPLLSFLLPEAVTATLAALLEHGTGNSTLQSTSGHVVPACFPLHRAGQFPPSFSENRPCQNGFLRSAECLHLDATDWGRSSGQLPYLKQCRCQFKAPALPVVPQNRQCWCLAQNQDFIAQDPW